MLPIFGRNIKKCVTKFNKIISTLKKSSLPDSPFGHLKSEGGWPSEGEEGADEDRGGRVGLDHLLLETDPVSGGGQSPGEAFAGQAGGNWPEGDRGGRPTQLRPQPRADLGEPAES